MANVGPLTTEIGSGVWGTQEIQQVSRLGFVAAAMSLTGGQPNFALCLAASWAGTTEFCQVQNSLCVRVLRSPVLAALLHGTPAAAVSQTLWRGTANGITELSQTAPPIFGWAAITLSIGPHSSFLLFKALSHCNVCQIQSTVSKLFHVVSLLHQSFVLPNSLKCL